MPPDAGPPNCQVARRGRRPHGRHLGDHADPELERRAGLHRRSEDRHAARRDDRALVVRLLDRHGADGLLALALAGAPRGRGRRRPDSRQHPARDRLDRDPHRDRPLGAIYSWTTLSSIEAHDPDRMVVDVYSQQYEWHFNYPEQGTTSRELHVPVDRQIEFRMHALDVIHSFWVPEWRIK